MPKVSVLMPTFNVVSSLQRGVESILAQTYNDFELLVVNDCGSDDGTRERIESYAEKDGRVRLIQLQEREGLAGSLNIGIKACRGEFIARMDADDYAYPARLARQMEFMDEHPNVVICGTALRQINSDGSMQILMRNTDDTRIKAQLLFSCALGHPTVMFRKDEFQKNGWEYDGSYLAEDFELWTRVEGEMANLPEILLDYYNDMSNRSNQSRGKLAMDSCRIVKQQMVRKLGIPVEQYPNYLFWPYLEFEKLKRQELVMGYTLLHEIENRNRAKKVYEPESLADNLCVQWNQYLYYFSHVGRFPQMLPFLHRKFRHTFSESLAQLLGTDEKKIATELKRRLNDKGRYEVGTEDIHMGLCPSPRMHGAGRLA